MARGIILLLLVTPIVVAMALPSLSTRIEGSAVGERSNSFSLDSDSSSVEHKLQRVYSTPRQGEKTFTSEAYAVTWNPPDQQSHGDVIARQDSFEPEAYAVTWNPPTQQSQGDVAAPQSSFTPEAYAVTWNPPNQQSQGDVVARQSSFTPEAYAVTWKPPAQQSQGDVAARLSSFTPEAYAVTWNPPDQQSQGNVAASQSSFTPEAYAVNWNPPAQQSQGDVVARQSSFISEAYAVTWNPSDQRSHGDVVARQSSVTPEAYAVTSNPPDQRSHGDVAASQTSFMPEAYAVTWSPPSQQSQQSSFTPEAYAVTWSPPDQPTQATDVAEATPARGHGLHVEPGMLFTRKSLLPGTVLPEGTKFAGEGFPDPQRFVLRADADAIPFSSSQLDTILRMFRIPRGSKKAKQVAATLRTCEATESPDPHTCATSQQAATDFAAASLGVRASELVAVVTVVHGRKDAARYVVAPDGVARIGKKAGAAAVPCHPMAYPYLVHYCHRPADVEALRVELTGLGDGAAATTAIAMCHADTTSWDGRYFEMLNATRGEEICHFMPRNYVLWLPAADL